MTRIRESLVTALAGVFGLPLDERALWPDIILGGCLAFSLLFSAASLVTPSFDFTFTASSLISVALVLLAKQKKAVLGAALLFVGLRSLIAVILGFQWSAIILALTCFGSAGLLLRRVAMARRRTQ